MFVLLNAADPNVSLFEGEDGWVLEDANLAFPRIGLFNSFDEAMGFIVEAYRLEDDKWVATDNPYSYRLKWSKSNEKT